MGVFIMNVQRNSFVCTTVEFRVQISCSERINYDKICLDD